VGIADALPRLELVDLAWLGTRPLRGLCASLFDPPRDPRRLERLDRVRVSSGVQGVQSRGLLTLGWLASRLGWHDFRAETDRGAPVRAWRAQRREAGEVRIELTNSTGGASHGVVALELEAGTDRWSLVRDQTCICVEGPGAPARRQPARSHRDAELVGASLGGRSHDPLFRDALPEAARLAAAS
jgi:Glucose-6-phosphate dehydrogenase subunit C-terminal domain